MSRFYSVSILLAALVGFSQKGFADPTLPPGFTISTVAENVQGPTSAEFAPDGRLFVSQKSGELRVIKHGVLLKDPFVKVDTDIAGEHGLIGVAFDPEFAKNSYIYIFYIAKTPTIHARVSRFTAQGDTAIPGSEKPIIDLDGRGASIFHVSGAIHFGLDGKLYVSSGDNAGYPIISNAQTLTNVLGKMLRFNSDGSIPTDNPFYSTLEGNNRSIWAYGLRNPFSFSIQPATGQMYANDVGQESWEEINEIVKGGNYGWPSAEGMSTDSKFRNPVYTYAHNSAWDGGCAITGGTFYNPVVPQFPDQYIGKYFFMDYCKNWIHVFDPATGKVTPFAQGMTSSGVGLTVGPDGSIYFLSEWFNKVQKLSFTGSQAPEIITQPADQLVSVGSSPTFSVSVSGAQPIIYQWQKNQVDIPGANSETYTLPSATLADQGAQYRCVITNSFGSSTSASANLKVVAEAPPVPSIEFPLEGSHYNAGDTITFQGSAQDAKDGKLPASALTWEVRFQHDTHFHPFLSPLSGVNQGSFYIPTQGESSGNTWFRIYLTVQNSSGLKATQVRDIFPNKSTFTLQTNPPGLKVTLDGQPLETPLQVTGVVGFIRTLGVVSPQIHNKASFDFASWSDGLAQTHTFVTGANPASFTANFTPGVYTAPSGSITATPNPIVVCKGKTGGSTTLQWNSQGTKQVEIHINSPQGNLLTSSAGGAGSYKTPDWVGNGSTFYLQDVSDGLPLTSENTLSTVVVHVTQSDCNLDSTQDHP